MNRPVTKDVLPVLGEDVDRYRVIAELAQGGMAAVYVVHRQAAGFDKLFAMKVMLPHLRSDPQFATMFLDEAQIGSKVQHPNVVQIFDVGDRFGSPFMVMELLRGKSMSHILKARAQGRVFISRGLIFWILARVADGLHAAHIAMSHDSKPLNIVHRDVSFQNVHIGFDGQVKVVDFGIADAEGRVGRTRTGEVLGKIQFMAPEQFNREHAIDRRVDLWSLGVVAWRAIAGSRLFRGKSDAETMWNVVHGNVPDIENASKEPLPPAVAQMVMSCLSRDPRGRPVSAAKFAEVFHQAALAEGGSTEELALFMGNAFFDAKRAEETALSEAMQNPQAFSESTVMSEIFSLTPADGSEPISAPAPGQVETAHLDRGKSRKGVVILGVLTLAALGAIAYLLLIRQPPEAKTEVAAEVPGEVAAEVSAEASPGASTEAKAATTAKAATRAEAPKGTPAETKPLRDVEIRLDPAVRMALVDGVRHDERPLVLKLAEDATAVVTVLTADSEKAWTIGIKDDGRLLELPTPPATEAKVEPDPEIVKSNTGGKGEAKKNRNTDKGKRGNKGKRDKKKGSGGALIEVPL